MPQVSLDAADAGELAELLQFVSDGSPLITAAWPSRCEGSPEAPVTT